MSGQEEWDGSPAWLFLLGTVVFLGSGLLFFVDLVRGIDVLRALAGNAVGMTLLIIWAAHDSVRNPDSEVDTSAGAFGTALLLYGLYLLATGAVIALTSLVHDHLQLGFWYAGLAVVAVVAGYIIVPKAAFLEGDEETEPDDNRESASDGDHEMDS